MSGFTVREICLTLSASVLLILVTHTSFVTAIPIGQPSNNELSLLSDEDIAHAMADNDYGYPNFDDGTFLDMPVQKRRLSINNDLSSLAAMLNQGANRRKSEQAQSLLLRLGKRGIPFQRESRTPRLSVGVPLDTLTDKIQSQMRQHMAENAHNMLMRLGKRSTKKQDAP